MRIASSTLTDRVSARLLAHGPMLSPCSAPGCVTLTMGGTCVQHDLPVTREFPRGRPFPDVALTSAEALAAVAAA